MLSEEQNDKSWYLIYSKLRKEKSAQENLERQGYKTYLPLICNKVRRRAKSIAMIEPLFPRYLFIHLDKTSDNWLPIRSTIGVSRIVHFDFIPAQVPDAIVSTLLQNEDESGLQCVHDAGYQAGDAIRVVDGPIKGYQGIFMAETSQERVVILLNMIGKQSKLTIPGEHITRVNVS